MSNSDLSSLCRIRDARADEAPVLQEIERGAAKRFGAYPEVRFCVDLPVRDEEEHRLARSQGFALVTEIASRPVGFALVVTKDGRAHILEIAIARAEQGRGLGRALIAAVESRASEVGLRELTLTTFRDVPWNAPFYARLGFEVFDVGSDRPEFTALIAEEAKLGVHAAPRVAMRKMLATKSERQSAPILREERADDFSEIRELVRSAFETAPQAEGDEQDFVERQRSVETYIPELAFVMERDGRLIAHIMLTRTFVSTPRGPHPILLLACAAVATEERGRGIGTSLIETAFRRARNLGHKAIVLVGDPTFYSRFGFQPSVRFGITNANGLEHEHVQIRELFPGALRNVSGAILLPT